MRDKFEMRVDWLSLIQSHDNLRGWETGAMSKINRGRMRDMANAAVLVLEGPVVPVTRGLEGERHHQDGQQDGQDPMRSAAWQLQFQFPHQIVLRRSNRGNRCLNFVSESPTTATLHLQHIAIASDQFVQHGIDEETEK